MDKLKHLNCEFHIPEPAAPQFDFQVFLLLRDKAFNTFTHFSAVKNKIFPGRCIPHQLPRTVYIFHPQLRVPGNVARFQQSLELPVLSPFLIILIVRFERPHQRARFAFRAKGTIYLPERRLIDTGDN